MNLLYQFFACILLSGTVLAYSGLPLDDYVNLVDDVYHYEVLNSTYFPATGSASFGYTLTRLSMTSLRWQTSAFSDHPIWQHTMLVCVPDVVLYPNHGYLVIVAGNDTNDGTDARGTAINVCQTGGIGASLHQIPNQPVKFPDTEAGLTEDRVIAHTFRSFLNESIIGTNPSQIVLFPMAKAAKRALDTIQDFARTKIPNRSFEVATFTVAGISKRGWTTWLLAACDERVTSIVPIVIGLLNMQNNIPNIHRSLGEWGFALYSYTDQHIFEYVGLPEYEALEKLVDPLRYNDRLANVKKYIIDSSLDQFFMLDGARFWYSQLKGSKHLSIIPNADHSFTVPGAGPQLIQHITSWYQAIAQGVPLPVQSHELRRSNDTQTVPTVRLVTENAAQVYAAKLWTLTSTRPGFRDFRLNTCDNTTNPACFSYLLNGVLWQSTSLSPISVNGNVAAYEGNITNLSIAASVSAQRWTGFFVEVMYAIPLQGAPTVLLPLTSEANVFPDFYPFGYEPDYDSIGKLDPVCVAATVAAQSSVSAWNNGNSHFSQWSATITVGRDLYSARIEIDAFTGSSITSVWGLELVPGSTNLYTIPVYKYQNGKIPAGSTITFGYITDSANAASISLANNACRSSSSTCSLQIVPRVTSEWSDGVKSYSAVNLEIRNSATSGSVAANADVVLNLAGGASVSSYWNLVPVAGSSNRYTCPLYNLAAGQTSTSCGYIIQNGAGAASATISSPSSVCIL